MSNSLIHNVTYISDDDDGDEIFADYDPQTVPTQPLSHSLQPPNSFKPKETQHTYVTQPTQPLQNGPDSASNVQVNASSPLRLSPKVPQIKPWRGGLLANSMAPPGTQFRSPFLQSQQQKSQQSQQQSQRSQFDDIEFSDDDQHPRALDSSDEEDGNARSGIKQSVFVNGGKPINTADPTVIRDSPLKQPTNFSRFSYQPPSVPQKRSADAMANGYSASRPPKSQQTAPAKALPVSQPDLKLEDIEDYSVRKQIKTMRDVFGDTVTIRQCQDALRKRNYNAADAMNDIATEQEQQDNTGDDVDELNPKSPNGHSSTLKPGVKRDVKTSKSINEKWSSQYRKSNEPKKAGSKPASQRPLTPPPKKPKKKLIRIQPPSPESSPPAAPPPKKQPTALPSRASSAPTKPAVESDIDEGIDLKHSIDDDDSESAEEQKSYSQYEDEFVKFLNTCSTADLVEVSNQPEETINQIIQHRPYTTLDSIRNVTIESTSTTKAGKLRTSKKKIGERFVDNCLEMWDGYKAVDELVAECEQIGEPVKAEMKQLGFDASGSEGELQLVNLESLGCDSGIGTPNPSGDEGSDDLKVSVRPQKKNAQLLSQPALMSQSCTLKDYQLTGLNWLSLLFSKNMSGILADDMGLGKTIQVIALLAHLYETGVKSTHLVIVPGSTLENWLREFKNFCPALHVEPYYGSQKDRGEIQYRIEAEIENINVVVTTYDMAMSEADNKFLRRTVNPAVCVFDEAHSLKNSNSKRYRQLMRIPADFRLLLTGTPLQNNLQELVSLLAFIMPDVFQSRQEQLQAIFKHKAKAVDDSGHAAMLSAQRIRRARAMITPFILRRKKEQVLKHLPRKTCRVEYCDLTVAQKAIYNEQVAKIKAQWSEDGQAANKKAKSNVLMDLRKAAIHPLLFRQLYSDAKLVKMARACLAEPQFAESNVDYVQEDMSVMTDYELLRFCRTYDKTMSKYLPAGTPWMDSGKVSKLVQVLHKNISTGNRTLIFSQFTMVMDILEEVLESEGITFSRLDGSTKMQERQDLIDQFTTDETISVFMLSTKAGGAGINLACANKVVIFDSSFNPQDDIQAENRAHRVGQTRPVEVVRLVTRGTIEEQIHALGRTKLALDERVAGDGGSAAKEDAAAEKEGMAMVERMLKGEEPPSGDLAAGLAQKQTHPPMPDRTVASRATPVDLKDEYMKSLKAAGLDVAEAK